MSLNSQFIIVLDSINCFSVQFSDNSLVLKICFQAFSFTSKKVQGFSSDRYSCRCYQCSFIYKTVSQFFKILIFSKDIWGTVHYYTDINIISKGNLIKAFYLPSKTNYKKSEDG